MNHLLLAALGLAGVFTRYGIQLTVLKITGSHSPLATAGINMVGSFLFGITYALSRERQIIPESLVTPLMTGFLGGFTTFSAFSLDSLSYFSTERYLSLGIYVLASVGGGISFTALGIHLAKFI